MRKEVEDLMSLFKDSFINENNELILVPKTNLYFRLDDVNTIEDLIYKIFAWCSRDCYKAQPFYAEWRNNKYHNDLIDKFNEFLGVDYNIDKWEWIYTEFGNGCNKEKCREFIKEEFKLCI